MWVNNFEYFAYVAFLAIPMTFQNDLGFWFGSFEGYFHNQNKVKNPSNDDYYDPIQMNVRLDSDVDKAGYCVVSDHNQGKKHEPNEEGIDFDADESVGEIPNIIVGINVDFFLITLHFFRTVIFFGGLWDYLGFFLFIIELGVVLHFD